jgi:hypothetical protein
MYGRSTGHPRLRKETILVKAPVRLLMGNRVDVALEWGHIIKRNTKSHTKIHWQSFVCLLMLPLMVLWSFVSKIAKFRHAISCHLIAFLFLHFYSNRGEAMVFCFILLSRYNQRLCCLQRYVVRCSIVFYDCWPCHAAIIMSRVLTEV